MSAVMKRTRPRGFIRWNPQAKTRILLADAQAVLNEYRDHLPLTIRQVYYRLVGLDRIEKTEGAYERLAETLNKARRARIIPFSALRDDGFTVADANIYASRQQVFDTLRAFARTATLDRQVGQARYLRVWCEAGGMVPQLARVAHEYGIPVVSSGGFDSVTAKYDMAMALAKHRSTILHIGDHDPSGQAVHTSLEEDLRAFAPRADLEFVRLAVTPTQAHEHNLPSAPPKASDRRRFDGDETWQAEALPPPVLASIVRTAIEARVDHAVMDAVAEREQDLRLELDDLLGGLA